MTDKEILDWIEDEVRHCIGAGAWWHVMHEIHLNWNLSLREAVKSTQKGITAQKEPKKFEGSRVDVEEIDYLLLDDDYDPDSFVGKKLIYHDDRAYRLMKLPTGRLVAAISHRCEFCHKNPVTLFHGSGLHNGAWCYGYGFNGEYVANFRDQNYVCAQCNERMEISK